jgi:hypothetical protein
LSRPGGLWAGQGGFFCSANSKAVVGNLSRYVVIVKERLDVTLSDMHAVSVVQTSEHTAALKVLSQIVTI